MLSRGILGYAVRTDCVIIHELQRRRWVGLWKQSQASEASNASSFWSLKALFLRSALFAKPGVTCEANILTHAHRQLLLVCTLICHLDDRMYCLLGVLCEPGIPRDPSSVQGTAHEDKASSMSQHKTGPLRPGDQDSTPASAPQDGVERVCGAIRQNYFLFLCGLIRFLKRFKHRGVRLAFIYSNIEGSFSHLFIQASRGQTRICLFKHRDELIYKIWNAFYRNHSFLHWCAFDERHHRMQCSWYVEQSGQFFLCPLRSLFRSNTKSVYWALKVWVWKRVNEMLSEDKPVSRCIQSYRSHTLLAFSMYLMHRDFKTTLITRAAR